jgi:hypothetical protein
MLSRSEVALNRRAFLGLAAGGLGALALAHFALIVEASSPLTISTKTKPARKGSRS